MKSKTVAICAFAGAILATTVGTANSTPLHASRGWHHSHGRVAGLGAHHRGLRHSVAATSRHRHHARSYVARGIQSEKSSLANAAVSGGLMAGIASVYSGERTANGEFASAGNLTAAHRTLPFGTLVKVTRQGTGRSVVVRINDRGPFVRGRVIDLTPAGARALGFSGLAPVTLSVVSRS
jgi:rare lipoprotein A